MSRIFGRIMQNGYIVADLAAAIDPWTRMLGIGPFFRVDHLAISDYKYRGLAGEPDISVGLANSCDLQNELIEVHGEGHSHFGISDERSERACFTCRCGARTSMPTSLGTST